MIRARRGWTGEKLRSTWTAHPAKVHLFCLLLCYSQRFFVMAFPRESQEAFFAGHVAAFQSWAVFQKSSSTTTAPPPSNGCWPALGGRAAGVYRLSLPPPVREQLLPAGRGP